MRKWRDTDNDGPVHYNLVGFFQVLWHSLLNFFQDFLIRRKERKE